ncbi:hypothetical protein [Allosphingosinicella vermicomposti]|uniref:hypothetical protein n=1 Tax=Allosphingosinicella vermicomposti TaxID=614671 RepID=UPI000D113552|nr:hypothetical protein [Allosphingosinicella vermicomposti]
MVYAAIPLIILGALGYMFWRAAARMRWDRIRNERQATRGRHAFTRFHRARFLLDKAFKPRLDEPRWQAELRRRLERAGSRSDRSGR